MIVQTGPRTYQLRARSTGKVLGTWPSYAGALRQERAIWAAKGRRAAGVRPNPSTRRMYAQELRSGDTIELEDLGREHVIQGPYRSARGIRFVDQHGVSLILQPNEIVRLVERENPWMATKTTKHYPQVTYTDDDAMHRWVGWTTLSGRKGNPREPVHFAMIREYRRDAETRFGKHKKRLWAPVTPREEHHFSVEDGELVLPGHRKATLRETVLAKEMYARLKGHYANA